MSSGAQVDARTQSSYFETQGTRKMVCIVRKRIPGSQLWTFLPRNENINMTRKVTISIVMIT